MAKPRLGLLANGESYPGVPDVANLPVAATGWRGTISDAPKRYGISQVIDRGNAVLPIRPDRPLKQIG